MTNQKTPEQLADEIIRTTWLAPLPARERVTAREAMVKAVEADRAQRPAPPVQVGATEEQVLAVPNDVCSSHRPVQHRDAKEPWCKACGLTGDGREPNSRLRGGRRE